MAHKRAALGLALLAVFCLSCGGGGDGETPTGPSNPAEMVTETFDGDLRNHRARHPFSMSQAGPVTITIVAFSTPWPELDSIGFSFCSELRPPHILEADGCVPLEWSLPYDLDGQIVGGFGVEGTFTDLPVSHSWRLPPSEKYALAVINGIQLYGPEYTYTVQLTHPR